MIPAQVFNIGALRVENQTSRTYKLDLEKKRIVGKIDNEDAILQLVLKILHTERYAYVIYSQNYGVELDRLIGQDYNFIVSDIERTMTDALLADDRILSITDFKTEQDTIDTMSISFTVNSIIGQATIKTEVNII